MEKNRTELEGLSPDNVFIMGDLLSRLNGGRFQWGNSCRGLLVTTETVQEICWSLKKIIASSVLVLFFFLPESFSKMVLVDELGSG